MSNPIDSAATKEHTSVASPKVQSPDVVTHAVPLTTVPPQTSTKSKAKSSMKKTAPKIALSMSNLYLSENPFKSSNVEADVTASGTSISAANVDATSNASETLGLDKPRSVENLGKVDVNPTVDDTTVAEAS
ncbi:hypothetical protein A2U01_0042125, partial [Trifolium medium]|nr:hypothetical protein [Trifolium medium]